MRRPEARQRLAESETPPGPGRPQPRRPVQVPTDGPGEFAIVEGSGPQADDSLAEGALTYTVEIERGLSFEASATATLIERTLADARGWAAIDGTSFERVDEVGQIRVLLATPTTTDELCAPLLTRGRVSCRNGDLVVLNALRWARGIEDYTGDLRAYRRYLVNHEVGHAIGRSHVACPGTGSPAPVMMQQTYGLEGCTQNPWPTVA